MSTEGTTTRPRDRDCASGPGYWYAPAIGSWRLPHEDEQLGRISIQTCIKGGRQEYLRHDGSPPLKR